jgi:hypothetical protein
MLQQTTYLHEGNVYRLGPRGAFLFLFLLLFVYHRSPLPFPQHICYFYCYFYRFRQVVTGHENTRCMMVPGLHMLFFFFDSFG